MVSGDLLFGGFVLVVGVLGTLFADRFTRFVERLDAIGSSTGPVEPPNWRVWFNRIVFAGLAVVGAVLVWQAVGGYP